VNGGRQTLSRPTALISGLAYDAMQTAREDGTDILFDIGGDCRTRLIFGECRPQIVRVVKKQDEICRPMRCR
jgi:hypothetical protein